MPDDDAPKQVDLEIPPRVLEGIPDVPAELLRTTPYLVGGESDQEIDAVSKGQCLVCGSEFGSETAVLIGGDGIIYAVCNPVCLDDMTIMGWLQEKGRDIIQTVQFRGESNERNQ